MNTGAVYYQSKTSEKCLESTKREKNNNYLNACLNERRHFTPFFASVYGLLGVEAEATLKHIASRLAQKWKEPYSCTCRYVKSRVEINLAWATHRCIRGGRFLASRISVTHPQWEYGAVLHLFW